MTSQTNIQSFKDFILKNRSNRLILYFSATAIIIQFAIFKYLYPYASYIHGDSFSYINAADRNLNINTYLIGYSKLLRLFSVFNKTDYTLTAFQYLFIQCSALYLLFTIFYFYKPGKLVYFILPGFMVLNPLFLHLANLISSDCIFIALSLTWFSLLLWIIHSPSMKVIVWHAIVLFIAFTFRYNALIYPFIAAIGFLLSRLPLRKKIAGIGMGLLFCGLFVWFTSYKYKQLTGYWQYSPFSGWQLANNAMYAYRYVDSTDRKPVARQYQALDNLIRTFFDRTKNTRLFPSEKAQASTFYMWSPGMPLMVYRDSLFKVKDSTSGELRKWASMGPFYKNFGIYIIKKYPIHFLKWFIGPNALKYYAPPVEFLESYNSGRDQVTDQTRQWFGYQSKKVKLRMKDPNTWVLDFYPILSGVINVIMLFGLLYYFLLKGWRKNVAFNKTIIMASAVWMVNAVFTISASSAALRFQSFPILLTTTFALLLVDWMIQLMKQMKFEQSNAAKMKNQDEGISGYMVGANVN